MILIVGLGNPGEKYLIQRHNMGFMVIDAFAGSLNSASFKMQKKCLVSKVHFLGKPLLLVKPQSYMNCSGVALFPLVQFYNVSLTDVLLVHDDMDQNFRSFRYQRNRGHGGHNGVRDIFDLFKTKDFHRLKVGIGRPVKPLLPSSYVLEDFSSFQQRDLPSLLLRICKSLECFIEEGFTVVTTKFNTKDFLLDEKKKESASSSKNKSK